MHLFSVIVALALAAPKGHVSLGKVTASENLPAVTRQLKAQVQPLEGCFDLATKTTPGLKGTLTLTFVVEPEAGVTTMTASDDSLKDDTLVPCVMARLRAGVWPVKKQPLTITAAFKFR